MQDCKRRETAGSTSRTSPPRRPDSPPGAAADPPSPQLPGQPSAERPRHPGAPAALGGLGERSLTQTRTSGRAAAQRAGRDAGGERSRQLLSAGSRQRKRHRPRPAPAGPSLRASDTPLPGLQCACVEPGRSESSQPGLGAAPRGPRGQPGLRAAGGRGELSRTPCLGSLGPPSPPWPQERGPHPVLCLNGAGA